MAIMRLVWFVIFANRLRATPTAHKICPSHSMMGKWSRKAIGVFSSVYKSEMLFCPYGMAILSPGFLMRAVHGQRISSSSKYCIRACFDGYCSGCSAGMTSIRHGPIFVQPCANWPLLRQTSLRKISKNRPLFTRHPCASSQTPRSLASLISVRTMRSSVRIPSFTSVCPAQRLSTGGGAAFGGGCFGRKGFHGAAVCAIRGS